MRNSKDLPAGDANPPRGLLYVLFFRASLVCTLTLGATFGAVNLLFSHLSLGPVPPVHNWIHASFQLWGFVLLFTMGVAYETFPGLLRRELPLTGPPAAILLLASPGLARATLWLSIAGLLATTYGRFGELLPQTGAVYLFGAIATLCAVLAWSLVLCGLWRKSNPRFELYHAFLAAGTLWWIAAAALSVLGGIAGFLEADSDRTAGWNDSVYGAAMYGGTLCWIQGLLLRIGPGLLELAPNRAGPVTASFFLGQAGAALALIGALRLGHGGAFAAEDAGLLLLAAAVATFVLGLRPFSDAAPRGAAAHGHETDTHFKPMVRMSLAFSLLFAVLAAGYGAADLAGLEPGKLAHDGVRHAFSLGFVTLMIFAAAGRIIPLLGGSEMHRPHLRYVGSYLIAGGVLMREVQIAASLFRSTKLLHVSGVSGLVAASGVAMVSISIWGTLRRSK